MIRRKVAAVAAAVALLFGVAFATAQPATAASGDPGYVYSGTDVRYGPGYFYGVAYVTSYDAWIPLGCWRDSSGYRWFSLYGQDRWIRADNVENTAQRPQPVLPRCT